MNCCAETDGSGPQGVGCGARGRRQQTRAVRVEGKVRRKGREPGAGSQAVAPRERAATEAGGRPLVGQGSLVVGDPKKRLELVAMKAAIGQIQEEYAVVSGGRAL